MNHKELISHNFIGINDSTLREGEQYNGSVFSLDNQKQILKLLYEIGVDTVEVGNPIVPEISQDLKILTQIPNRPPLMAHIRNKDTDLLAAIDTNVDGVHLLCTADPTRLETMHLKLEDHLANMVQNVQRAQKENIVVRVSVEHGLERKFFTDALKILKVADSLGVDRVQVADTRGVLFPWEIEQIIQALRQEIQAPIGVHLHNDFGQAVANADYALAAGANWIDTTLLGVGERTGITPLSTLLVNLCAINPQLFEKYNLTVLTSAEQQMADILNMTIPHNLITSPTAFSHKAGIHINGLKKQGTATYEAIRPEIVGNERIIVTDSRISGKKQTL